MSSVEPPRSDGGRRSGRRALRNTGVRALGEIVGKLASLALFAVLARRVGAAHFGVYVFALAWGEVAATPVGLGIDRYLLRRIARDRTSLDDFFMNAMALKLGRAAAVMALTVAAVLALGYRHEKALTVCLVTAGVLVETLSRSHVSTFNAFERSELVAATVVAQRFAAAALGLALLLAGYGVVAVSLAFLAGSLVRLALASHLLVRRIAMPALALPRAPRRELRSRSLAYTTQDVFGLVIARADVLLLAALASSATVGVYGAAYRLLDATSFIGVALGGAFVAMYTYLDRDSSPTIHGIFERSIKLCLLALVPIGVAFAVLAEPLARALFGPALAAAGAPLRLLAGVVVLAGTFALTSNLITSRRDPRELLRLVVVAAAVNLGLNLVLIPRLGARGAAVAMLASEVVLAGPALALAARAVGGVNWVAMTAAPLGAGVAMAAVTIPLAGSLPAALAAGGVVYVLAYAALERAVSPADLAFALSIVRARLPRRDGASA